MDATSIRFECLRLVLSGEPGLPAEDAAIKAGTLAEFVLSDKRGTKKARKK